MATIKETISKFLRGECGATAIEYSLIASLVSIVIIGALKALGTSVGNLFTSVASSM